MPFNKHHRKLEAFYSLTHCNPFSSEYLAHERELLGRWNQSKKERSVQVFNLSKILLGELRDTAAAGKENLCERSAELYENLALHFLFHSFQFEFENFGMSTTPKKGDLKALFFESFLNESEYYLGAFSQRFFRAFEASHWFAIAFQRCRAFREISTNIIGTSIQIEDLRCAIWESVFTHDARRHMTSCYPFMNDIPTLILGPAGSGHGAIAQSLAYSRYIEFDAGTKTFAQPFKKLFPTVSFQSLSAELAASELFALQNGFLSESNQGHRGSVYLHEIGNADALTQMKISQMLERRTLDRNSDGTSGQCFGKIMASSSQDLEKEVEAGIFCIELFRNLRVDVIRIPPLSEQLGNAPNDLRSLIFSISQHVAGTEQAQRLTDRVMSVVSEKLGTSYTWPGDIRELEQCVSHVMIRNAYAPFLSRTPQATVAVEQIGDATAEEVVSRYCTLLYAKTGSYEEASRIANLDRRTFKSKVDEGLLEEMRNKMIQ